MDEQKKQPDSSRNAAPASPPPGRDPGPGAVKRHRGRTIALIVAVVLIAGIVLVRWHPWNRDAAGASAAAAASGAQAGR
ncbi:multidrug transporter subunit MdtA, partial [Burkholderia sp. Ac-20365]|nr:multidrug transporter subunit MdtA [Burkholderia sp. Ac-20365]